MKTTMLVMRLTQPEMEQFLNGEEVLINLLFDTATYRYLDVMLSNQEYANVQIERLYPEEGDVPHIAMLSRDADNNEVFKFRLADRRTAIEKARVKRAQSR